MPNASGETTVQVSGLDETALTRVGHEAERHGAAAAGSKAGAVRFAFRQYYLTLVDKDAADVKAVAEKSPLAEAV